MAATSHLVSSCALLLLVLCATCAVGSLRPTHDINVAIDWQNYLQRCDPVWHWDSQGPPNANNERDSAFLGNGDQGLLIRGNDTAPQQSIRFTLGRTTLYDDRAPGANYSLGNFVIDRPRLPIGYFEVILANASASMQGGVTRLHLHNGSATITAKLSTGPILRIEAFTSARFDISDAHAVRVTVTDPSGQTVLDANDHVKVHWTPLPADAKCHNGASSYKPNPPPTQSVSASGTNLTKWEHLSGKQHAVGLRVVQEAENSLVIFATTTQVLSDATSQAEADVHAAVAAGFDKLFQMHATWWAQFYPQAFLSVDGDARVEQFYWIQLYKFASATRAGRAIYDLEGPWYIAYTGWPDLHWDLNLQETYYALFTGNRHDLVQPLVDLLVASTDNLVSNVRKAWQNDSAAAPAGASALDMLQSCYWVYATDPDTGACITDSPTVTGNLLWTLHLVDQLYSHTGNADVVRTITPLLRRAVNFHRHLQVDQGSAINLAVTFSPEYAHDNNTNYDLALYRNGAATLLHYFDLLDEQDPTIPDIKDTLKRLAMYPSDETTGWKIGLNTDLKPDGHRHYSHLFMAYPLRTINLTDTALYDLATKSIDYWCGRPRRSHYEVASSMSSWLSVFSPVGYDGGRRRATITNITYNFDNRLTSNTFYYEGTDGRCAESPAGTATAVQDMLLVSHAGFNATPDGVSGVEPFVAVFPGVDDSSITDAVFFNLSAEGGFLVSARRINGSTRWVRVESRLGRHLTLQLPNMTGPITVDPPQAQFKPVGGDRYTLSLSAGDVAVLSAPSADLTASPVDINPADYNKWGQAAPPPPPPPRLSCDVFGDVPGYTCHAGYCSAPNSFESLAGSQLGEDCGVSLAEPSISCASGDYKACASESAKLCDDTAGCASFGLCPIWFSMKKVKLFSEGTKDLVPNSDWNVWTKN